MEERMFDRIAFDVGDKVRRKFHEDEPQILTVSKVAKVTNPDNFTYLVIYCEETNDSPYVSLEFEPADKADRKKYYEIWPEALHILDSKTGKRNPKVKVKGTPNKVKTNVHTFNVPPIKKDGSYDKK